MRFALSVWPAIGLRLVLLAGCVLFLGWGLGRTGDVSYYYTVVQPSDSGLYPFFQFWMEYPPVFPMLAVGIYRVLAWLQLGSPTAFSVSMLVLLAGADVVAIVLVHRLAARVGGHRAAALAAIAYAACPIAIYFSLGMFDDVAVVCLLAGLLALMGRRAALAGVVMGIGILTKVFPGVLLLGAVVALDWRGRLRFVAASALTLVVCLAPFQLIRPDMLAATFNNIQTRAPWESVPALTEGIYSPGYVPPPTDRTTPPPRPSSGREALPRLVIYLPEAALLLLVAASALFMVRSTTTPTPRDVAVIVTLGLSVLLLTNKGFSPQFLAWLAPLLVIVWPNATGVAYLLAFSAHLMAYYAIVTPTMNAHALGQISDDQVASAMWISVSIRSVLLAVVAGHLTWLTWRRGRLPRPARLALDTA